MTDPEKNCDDPSVVFEAARGLEDAERQDYLNRVCRDKPDLRADIESMLAAHANQGEFLADPTVSAHPSELATIGSMIGPYKLREKIGEGGMGVVWAAEQTKPLRRKVALKLINREWTRRR